jgi:hypothetical protein
MHDAVEAPAGGVAAVEQRCHQRAVAYVALHEAVARMARHVGEVQRVAGVGQAVEVDQFDVRLPGEQQADQVAADEAHPAGDQYAPHRAMIAAPIIA